MRGSTGRRIACGTIVATITVLMACNGTGAAGGLPRALRQRAQNEEVVPYDGFTLPGLRLYRASGSVPDHGWSTVVAIDDSGNLVERADLMRRLGPLEPQRFAERALAILLSEAGSVPLQPGDERSQFATEQEWSAIAPPRRERGEVVFFQMRGEMHPTLVEVRIDVASFASTFRPATAVLVASGQEVRLGPPICHAIAHCGCWSGCEPMQRLQVPDSESIRYEATTGGDRRRYVDGPACDADGCLRVCRADAPSATCDPGLVQDPPEQCGEACPERESPFHCETLESGCRRIEHPIRSGR